MSRATDPQKAQRLNLALEWLRQGLSAAEAAQRLAATSGVSNRQAFRYIEQAQQLKRPVPVSDAKVSFTVKLSANSGEQAPSIRGKLRGRPSAKSSATLYWAC